MPLNLEQVTDRLKAGQTVWGYRGISGWHYYIKEGMERINLSAIQALRRKCLITELKKPNVYPEESTVRWKEGEPIDKQSQ